MLMEGFSMPTVTWRGYLSAQVLICLLKLKDTQFCKCQHHPLINNNILCPPKTVLFTQQVKKPILHNYRSFLLIATKTYNIRRWGILTL